MKARALWILLAGLAAVSASAEELQTLWKIGEPDKNTAEFAYAPGNYREYTQPAFFVVGRSDPKRDWPYVQPGVIDGGWAPGVPQTYEVVFAVQEAPVAACRLVLDFADTHSIDPPTVRVAVNDLAKEYQTPRGAGDASVYGEPAKGRPYQIALDVPAGTLKAGNNVVRITTLTGSWVLWDAARFEAPAGVKLAEVAGGTLMTATDAGGMVTVQIRQLGAPVEGTLQLGGQPPVRVELRTGLNTVQATSPDVEKEETLPLTLTIGAQQVAGSVTVKPVRKWEIYVLMHSHVDIGYTHLQPEIEKRQANNVIRALELIRQGRNDPQGTRFKWNLETYWVADQFFRIATPEQRREFEQAVHDGYIGIDALYGDLLTGLSRSEELLRQASFGPAFGRTCGVKIDSMMISDVPGLTWGLVPALAQNGVKYISDGPNAGRGMEGDRIGYVRVQWEHNPFWWVSPSGREKAIYWGAQGGYSIGHHYGSIIAAWNDLVKRLDSVKYPYDIVQLRWTKGDNGPPDESVMGLVRDWNAKHAYPKFIIATTSEAFQAFEKKYGDRLPTYRGDMTPYWEDGAGSSSRETGLNRHSADLLLQAETLWAMLNPAGYPAADFDRAWKYTAMYSEHTWGAHNSIHQPDLPFVKEQWRYKQSYALNADEISRKVMTQILPTGDSKAVDVFNTCSWPRTDLVTLPKDTAGDVVKDERGQPALSQRLTSGELAFLARDVPPFGTRRYTVEAGQPAAAGGATADGLALATPELSVRIDEASGDIVSIRRTGLDVELADGAVNHYLYLPGGNVNDAQPSGPATVSVKERGPLVASLLVESDAPGCNRLTREIRLISGLDRIEIANVIDKKAIRSVEGVHLGFAFNVPSPVVRVNSPGAVGEIEKDQLPGACKNWYSVERWTDISNDKYGVTWVTADAPLMEVGGLTANLPRSQPNPNAYLKEIAPSSKIFSWVMNNHWHTNYKADQDGPTPFRYALRPHGGYDPAAAHRFGVEATLPLIAAPASGKPRTSLVSIEPATVMASALKPSDDGKAIVLRLYGASGKDEQARLTWARPMRVTLSDGSERPGSAVTGSIAVPAWGLVTLRAEEP